MIDWTQAAELPDDARVSPDTFERGLARTVAGAAPGLPILPRDHPTARSARESALVFAGGAATLLQLAHPYIAQAIVDHSEVTVDLNRRFRRTFSIVHGILFDPVEEALKRARGLFGVHRRIRGELPEALGAYPAGHRYDATEPRTMLWVAATLWHLDRELTAMVFGPRSPAEDRRWYAGVRHMAPMYGVPPELVPPTLGDLDRYMADMFGGPAIAVGPAARRVAAQLLAPPRALAAPVYGSVHALTSALLPPRLRAAYGLRYGRAERRLVRMLVAALRAAIPRLPASLRYCPAWHRAARRERGRDGSDPVNDLVVRAALRMLS